MNIYLCQIMVVIYIITLNNMTFILIIEEKYKYSYKPFIDIYKLINCVQNELFAVNTIHLGTL